MSLYAVTCTWPLETRDGLHRGQQSETVVLDAPSGDHAYRRAYELRPDLPLASDPKRGGAVRISPVTTIDTGASEDAFQ